MISLRHVGIVVSDMEKSIHFYKDLLGLRVIRETDESGKYVDDILSLNNARVKTAKLGSDEGSLVELLYFVSPKGSPVKRSIVDYGCSHVAFLVEGIEAEYERLKGQGVIFNSPPKTSPDGFANVVFCSDPDGTVIELVEILEENK